MGHHGTHHDPVQGPHLAWEACSARVRGCQQAGREGGRGGRAAPQLEHQVHHVAHRGLARPRRDRRLASARVQEHRYEVEHWPSHLAHRKHACWVGMNLNQVRQEIAYQRQHPFRHVCKRASTKGFHEGRPHHVIEHRLGLRLGQARAPGGECIACIRQRPRQLGHLCHDGISLLQDHAGSVLAAFVHGFLVQVDELLGKRSK
mmetsp:Transcript_1575/g.6294  ORF Transcript_1575/g.6294 Transcript_1575/m.6294 type:complete len:203 (-) Transcript_1575:132-740(-)